MKKKTIALLLVLMLVFGVTCGGTIAYLTAQTETITNTFTVGNVQITLTEAKVNVYGELVNEEGETATEASTEWKPAARLDAASAKDGKTVGNVYKLIPGHEYIKDPTIHVDAASENCWVFVKIENNISAYEADTKIADQITTTNGWTALDGVANVYYKEYTAGQTDKDFEVFQQINIANNANTLDGWNEIKADTTMIKVTGYAVQADGMTGPKDAWDKAGFGA